jgi:hypothetical protein
LVDDELRRFIHGPVSAFLGTADSLQVPDCTRIAGLAAIGGSRFRILIAPQARTALANAVPGARAAIVVTDITTYRSMQWKGRVVAAGEERTPGDLALLHGHVEAFRARSQEVGITPSLVPRLFPVEVVPLTIEVDALYDQTPGPGAGRRLVAGA